MEPAHLSPPSVLFFSRGRGRGHAIPDLAIGHAIRAIRSDVNVQFVSYGTGAATFRQFGHEPLELDLPDEAPFPPALIQCCRLINLRHPDLVVAHEEWAALLASAAFDIPSLFITDFFQEPGSVATLVLEYAREILFLGSPGHFTQPPGLADRIRYLGAPVRSFAYRRTDRERARRELGLCPEGMILGCLPGSWREGHGSISSIVLEAMDRLPSGQKHLVWVAGDDKSIIARKIQQRTDVTVIGTDWQIDRLMVACDAVITRASRMTLQELDALCIPSVSLSFGLNWPDDVLAHALPLNIALDMRQTTGAQVANSLIVLVARSKEEALVERPWPGGIPAAAKRIVEHIFGV